MVKNNYKTIVMILAVFAVLGFGAYAFADRGYYGHHMYDGPGYGRHMSDGYGYEGHMYGGPHRGYGHHGYGDGYCAGRGVQGNLSQEQIENLEKQDDAFYKDTEKLRQTLYEKESVLRDELAKQKPDAGKAETLQKELSGLKAEFDQKRINHLIKMRQIAPEAGRAWRGENRTDGGPCWR